MRNRMNWMERLTEELDELSLPGQPLVEICGEQRVLIENHRGVSRYGQEEIRARVAFGELAVRGNKLDLVRMTKEQLLICGCIERVELIRRGGK